MVVVAVAAIRCSRAVLTTGDGPSTVSTTSLVTSRIVRSPISLKCPASTGSARFDLNVIAGYLSTAKKSAPRRSLSRASLFVESFLTSIVASARIDDTFFPSYQTVPDIGPSRPRTVDTTRCFTENPGDEWPPSIFQAAASPTLICADGAAAIEKIDAAMAIRIRYRTYVSPGNYSVTAPFSRPASWPPTSSCTAGPARWSFSTGRASRRPAHASDRRRAPRPPDSVQFRPASDTDDCPDDACG